MNKEETKKAIEVMQAYVDGKEIQVTGSGCGHWIDWAPKHEPKWNWDSSEYRVKPEPREWEMLVTPRGELVQNTGMWECYGRMIKVREVIE